MNSPVSSGSAQTWLAGAVAGVVAWLVGYGVTYARVAGDVRDSPLHQIVETLEGEPAMYEMVGWVFHNTHFVRTEFRDVPILGSHTTTFIGNDGFSTALYVIPVVALIGAGVALAHYRRPTDAGEGALLGAAVVPGYFLLTLASVFLFEVTVAGATGRPELVPAILLGGIAYPLVCGGGGALGWILGRDLREQRTADR